MATSWVHVAQMNSEFQIRKGGLKTGKPLGSPLPDLRTAAKEIANLRKQHPRMIFTLVERLK
jgi:hypothetical protein